MGKVCILRLGHRVGRDQRITTHVFLAARALGATEGVLCGEEDPPIIDGVARVCGFWGGSFPIRYEKNWKGFVSGRKKLGWGVAHLTMYGENFEEKIGAGLGGNWIVIVGAGKVPRAAYELADLNLAVTNQPHSEVAALALFLDRFYKGKELALDFGGDLKITPTPQGKYVMRKGKETGCRHGF